MQEWTIVLRIRTDAPAEAVDTLAAQFVAAQAEGLFDGSVGEAMDTDQGPWDEEVVSCHAYKGRVDLA
jgi:hypothetical protein